METKTSAAKAAYENARYSYDKAQYKCVKIESLDINAELKKEVFDIAFIHANELANMLNVSLEAYISALEIEAKELQNETDACWTGYIEASEDERYIAIEAYEHALNWSIEAHQELKQARKLRQC